MSLVLRRGLQQLTAYLMRKNILFVPPGNVESGAGGKKFETGLGEFGTTLAGQHHVQFFAQAVQIENVAGGVLQLLPG